MTTLTTLTRVEVARVSVSIVVFFALTGGGFTLTGRGCYLVVADVTNCTSLADNPLILCPVLSPFLVQVTA